MSDDFQYNINAKRTRLSDDELISSLESAVDVFGDNYFSTTQYDSLEGKRAHYETIIERFGSWKKALQLVGISGGREKEYSAEALLENLEDIWKQLRHPPGKTKIGTLGKKISESPYKRHWGSVKAACEALAAFHEGKISKDQLISPHTDKATRRTIPLTDRWAVLKRDKYRCIKCGASPSQNHEVELEVDHIIPVARGGGNKLDNLQTLCRDCNQGKKDK